MKVTGIIAFLSAAMAVSAKSCNRGGVYCGSSLLNKGNYHDHIVAVLTGAGISTDDAHCTKCLRFLIVPTFGSEDIPDLRDQVIIVTGGNVGLGYETIRQLSEHRPARIYLAARSRPKAEQAISDLKKLNPTFDGIRFLQLDLASFESVKGAAAEFLRQESRLDILVNNAGIMMTPAGLTKDGYEIQFGTNVLGPALLTQLLLPTLCNTAKVNSQARLVMLSSAAHARAPRELVNLHYAKALAERESRIKIIPVHPGMVATNLHHASTGTFLKPFLSTAIFLVGTPVAKGALSQIFAAVSPDAKHGQYYGLIGKPEPGSKLAQNHDLQEKVFKFIQSELSSHVEPIS
ncbi:putative oxidoreductase C736,13 [Talaromyces islandicus]|uniref:Putative oxidoreductase C736,13 n=1 Tax=Talaromyces islandicus TaxID=28573 RepID=A0A0U1LMS1_TALIS|nr:putative oxidoreductase C736,13 [Talaromyces islandicus]